MKSSGLVSGASGLEEGAMLTGDAYIWNVGRSCLA